MLKLYKNKSKFTLINEFAPADYYGKLLENVGIRAIYNFLNENKEQLKRENKHNQNIIKSTCYLSSFQWKKLKKFNEYCKN